jgi:hypothetical protein
MNQKKDRPVPIPFIVNRDLDTTTAFDSLHDNLPVFVDERSLGQPAGGRNAGSEGAPCPPCASHLYDKEMPVKLASQRDDILGR